MAPHETTPSPQHSSGTVQAQNHGLQTPQSQGSENSDQGPVRYRSLNDLFDSTEEIHDYEYSGLCMLAADEPNGVYEALEE